MGSGSYTTSSFVNYSNSMGRTVNTRGIVTADSLQDYYKQSKIHEDLKPFKIVRECCDSEEHPNTIPIILALDVTGSMGSACVKTAKALNTIMTSLYDKFEDVEFCIMGIGDLAYDDAPIQMSQYESDVRIAEHLDKVYMEHGGGNNSTFTTRVVTSRGYSSRAISGSVAEYQSYASQKCSSYGWSDEDFECLETNSFTKDGEKPSLYPYHLWIGVLNDSLKLTGVS